MKSKKVQIGQILYIQDITPLTILIFEILNYTEIK